MTVGFILVSMSVLFAWVVQYTPLEKYVYSGATVITLGSGSVNYYYAPMTMLTAGLFALLPVFSRKFMKDSETHASALALVMGFIAMILMLLYTGSLSDAMNKGLEEGSSAALGVGVYIAIIGCIVIVVGAALGVLNGSALKSKAAPKPEPEPANIPESALGPVPTAPVKECNEPIPTAVPVDETPQEVDPQSLDTVDVIGGRPIHERPKRP